MNDNQIMDEFVKFGQESIKLKDDNYELRQRVAELESCMPVLYAQKEAQDERDRNIKADAIEAAAKAIKYDVSNYNGDCEAFHIDELIDYAEAVRKGER